MYSHPLCKVCMLGDFCWLPELWLSWARVPVTLHAGSCLVGMTAAEVGMGCGGPEYLHEESTLTGSLKLKWMQVEGRGPRVLCAEGDLAYSFNY